MSLQFKKIILVSAPLLLIVVFTAIPAFVYGTNHDSSSLPTGTIIPNPLGDDVGTFEALIDKLIQNIVLPIGGVLITFFLIFSGFLFVTAQGNEEKLKTAKKALMWTVIGAFVLLGAAVIAGIIETTLTEIRE
ncbi:MAG: pilin [bacterium]|nr:pilin [bacterium]